MVGESGDYSLDVSEYLFRLTTESLRLLSNETQCYENLTSLVEKFAGPGAADSLGQHDIETLKQHLSKVPTEGPIRIHFEIAKASSDNLNEAKQRLCETLDADLTVADAISMLLFNYVVEKSATKLLARMGITPVDTTRAETGATDKVVPFR